MGAHKKIRTAGMLRRKCAAFFASIRYDEPVTRLVQVDISNKGKPIYEREDVYRTDEDGNKIPMTVPKWTRPPTLEALTVYLGISMDTWERYAKNEAFADICAWAKGICKEALLERGLNGESNAQLTQFVLENAYGMTHKITLDGVGFEDWLRSYRNEGPEM